VTVSQEETVKKLFEGIDPEEVNFSFVFDFGAGLLTHLGIACMCYDYSAVRAVPDNGSHSSKSVKIRSRDTPFGYRVHAPKYRRAAQGGCRGGAWESPVRDSQSAGMSSSTITHIIR